MGKIKIDGVLCTLVDGVWSCTDPVLLKDLESVSLSFHRLGYHPQPERELVQYAAAELLGEVVELPKLMRFDPKLIY